MIADPRVALWARPARLQSWRRDATIGVPLALLLAAIGWRLFGPGPAVTLLILGIGAVAIVAFLRARRFDRRWLIAALDASRRDLEDSSDLLFADSTALSPLQRIQHHRIAMRADAGPMPLLDPPRHPRLIVGIAIASLTVAAAILLWPQRSGVTLAPAHEGLPPLPGVPRLIAQALEVVPPAYTGLAPRVVTTLDARVPAGSQLRWTLRFAPEPRDAMLDTVGGTAVPLRHVGGDWLADRRADAPLLYRVAPVGGRGGAAGIPPLHRIDTIADRPPQVRVEVSRTALTLLAPGQRNAAIGFVATDDYGVRATARLRIVVAQGEGENVRFSERLLTLAGRGSPRERRFGTQLDFAALGFTEAGDIVAQLIVTDTRTPAPHQVRGPSIILRRPAAAAAEGGGLEAMTRRVMPAYFRSQRQIIIDAEALLAARPRPSADRFLSRSDAIGADQRLLRMRYGQFMGEEVGGGATNALPTNDEEEGQGPTDADGHADTHDHPPPSPGLGMAQDVTADYGHTHDEAEAATLLDPATRATLRQALDNMWQSESALRQGEPRKALPYAYKALRFIKQVQQATRIFLARTGSNLPAIDMARRLTGDRGAMGPRGLPSAAAEPVDATPAAIWRALDGPRPDAALDALTRWLRSAGRVADPLALAGAIDTARRRPDCVRCREALRGQLWQALPRPAPGVARRDAGDAIGGRYLDALP